MSLCNLYGSLTVHPLLTTPDLLLFVVTASPGRVRSPGSSVPAFLVGRRLKVLRFLIFSKGQRILLGSSCLLYMSKVYVVGRTRSTHGHPSVRNPGVTSEGLGSRSSRLTHGVPKVPVLLGFPETRAPDGGTVCTRRDTLCLVSICTVQIWVFVLKSSPSEPLFRTEETSTRHTGAHSTYWSPLSTLVRPGVKGEEMMSLMISMDGVFHYVLIHLITYIS